MFCKNCGNELSDDAIFCPKCGSPVKENFDLAQNKSANPKIKIEPFMLIASFICSLIGFVLAIVSFVNTKNPASLCSIFFVIIVAILLIVSVRFGLRIAEANGIL